MPPAARLGDITPHPGVVGPPGVFNVLIGGQPAAVHPPTPFVPGCPTVLIGGMPALRVGDMSGCGAPVLPPGCPTVLIGG